MKICDICGKEVREFRELIDYVGDLPDIDIGPECIQEIYKIRKEEKEKLDVQFVENFIVRINLLKEEKKKLKERKDGRG